MSFTIGFDLDMTLIDPRPGMIALFDVLAAETGIPLDGHGFASRLGPPLAHEFARYNLPDDVIATLIDRFRELYISTVIPLTTEMPGAREAVAAVTERGGRVVVITGKFGPNAEAHLRALQIEAAAVIGELWGHSKAGALREFEAEVYVGDHLGDVAGAREADAMAVGVATGPISAEDLAAAGADVVLHDLTGFPSWLDAYLLATVH
ncbi:HAD family hydrolase [Nakamurella silvestris]|nr:HAD family hydrolase [Nakamurella silvestris]